MAMPHQRRSPSPGSEMPARNPRTPSFRRSGPNPSARTPVRIGNTPKLFVPGLLDSLGILPRVQVALSLAQVAPRAKYYYLAPKAMTLAITAGYRSNMDSSPEPHASRS